MKKKDKGVNGGNRDESKVIDLRMFSEEDLAKRSAQSGTKRRRGAGGVGASRRGGGILNVSGTGQSYY